MGLSGQSSCCCSIPSMMKYTFKLVDHALTVMCQFNGTRPRRSTVGESVSLEELPSAAYGHVLERVETESRVSFMVICPFLVREIRSESVVGDPSGGVPLPRDHLVRRLHDISTRRESDASEAAQLALQVIEQSDHQIHLSDEGKITFGRLHRLYPRGSTVYGLDDGGWRAYKVDRVERPGGPRSEADLHVHVFFLDFDETGLRLVPQSALLVIPPYASARKVGSLPLVPDWYMQRPPHRVVNDLLSRGDRFWHCGGAAKCFAYKGNAWPGTLDAVSGARSGSGQ
jgi:hypothetical protein